MERETQVSPLQGYIIELEQHATRAYELQNLRGRRYHRGLAVSSVLDAAVI